MSKKHRLPYEHTLVLTFNEVRHGYNQIAASASHTRTREKTDKEVAKYQKKNPGKTSTYTPKTVTRTAIKSKTAKIQTSTLLAKIRATEKFFKNIGGNADKVTIYTNDDEFLSAYENKSLKALADNFKYFSVLKVEAPHKAELESAINRAKIKCNTILMSRKSEHGRQLNR